jgi:hypothetical protein
LGQHQLLLLTIVALVVSISVAVGYEQFHAQYIQSNREGVTMSLVNITADAYQYKIRQPRDGGGSGSYRNYQIPSRLTSDAYGIYILGSVRDNAIEVRGVSKMDQGWLATCSVDDTGKYHLTYTGW